MSPLYGCFTARLFYRTASSSSPFVASSLRRSVATDKYQTLPNRRQHPKRQTIDLQNPQRIDVVFVPFDKGPSRHGPVSDGYHLAKRASGDDESTDVLREVAGKTDELTHQPGEHAHRAIVRIQPHLVQHLVANGLFLPPLVLLGQRGDAVKRQAECLTDVAYRRARTIGNDLGDDTGVRSSVFAVDVLEHFLAAFVLEVHVDIGRLVSFGADEPLEQQVHPARVDGGDAQAVADGRIRRTASTLA